MIVSYSNSECSFVSRLLKYIETKLKQTLVRDVIMWTTED